MSTEEQNDCREAFEKWLAEFPKTYIHDDAWTAWQAAWQASRSAVTIENDRVCIGGRWFLPTDDAKDPRAESGLVKELVEALEAAEYGLACSTVLKGYSKGEQGINELLHYVRQIEEVTVPALKVVTAALAKAKPPAAKQEAL